MNIASFPPGKIKSNYISTDSVPKDLYTHTRTPQDYGIP